MKRLLHPAAQILKQRLGASLTNIAAKLGGLSADFFFDSVKSADAGECLCRNGRSVSHVDVMELAPCVSPAGHFIDRAIAVEMMKSGVMWRVT
jgi:hypothetical protein